TDTFVSTSAPVQLASDIANDYASFDPGPNHHCATGGLANSVFDNDTTQNNSAATFELVPGSSYTCISQSGAGTGVIEVAGTVTFNGNSTQLCAESPCSTASTAWQGNSGNNSMLTLVALASNNSAAIQF